MSQFQPRILSSTMFQTITNNQSWHMKCQHFLPALYIGKDKSLVNTCRQVNNQWTYESGLFKLTVKDDHLLD